VDYSPNGNDDPMPTTQLKRLISFLLLLLTLVSGPSHGEECLASTDARPIMSTSPELQSEKLVADAGKYSAVLKNGDIVLAKFATCDLGMSAHYLSKRELTAEERMARVKMFLTRVLPSAVVVNKVIPQLANLNGNSFDQAVVLDGLGDQHQIVIKPSTNPLFTLDIQYTWIPPEF
jgi:hypothetical protein